MFCECRCSVRVRCKNALASSSWGKLYRGGSTRAFALAHHDNLCFNPTHNFDYRETRSRSRRQYLISLAMSMMRMPSSTMSLQEIALRAAVPSPVS